jgi:hypothetical protein
MPRTNQPPKYRHHKARNLAVVTINGHDHYLGAYGSPESRQEYARLIAEWSATGTTSAAPTQQSNSPSINEIILAFWRHAEDHYQRTPGSKDGELDNLRLALRPLRRL